MTTPHNHVAPEGFTSAGPSTVSPPKVPKKPSADLLINSGFPAIQYETVDNSNQFQKYLIVCVQVLSGTDPANPPNYNPELSDDGMALNIKVPVSPILTDPHLLTDPRAAWMKNDASYEADKNARLASLGIMVADLQSCAGTTDITMDWSLPLSVKCSEVVGNYSIGNFRAKKNKHNMRFYPVIVKFKLKVSQQSVKSMGMIQASAWMDSDDEEEGIQALESPRKKQAIIDPKTLGL